MQTFYKFREDSGKFPIGTVTTKKRPKQSISTNVKQQDVHRMTT